MFQTLSLWSSHRGVRHSSLICSPISIILSIFTLFFIASLFILDIIYLGPSLAALEATFLPSFITPSIVPLECNLFNGSWVFDESYPLYTECPFIERGFQCPNNGRQNLTYRNWRWQPFDCNIPRLASLLFCIHTHTHTLCLCLCLCLSVSFLCMHVCIICIFWSQHRTWIYLLSFDSHIQVWCNEYAHEVKGPTSGFCGRLHGSNTVGVTCLPANEWSPWQMVSERDSWKSHYKDNTTPCCLVPRVQCDNRVLPISMARAYWAASKACT